MPLNLKEKETNTNDVMEIIILEPDSRSLTSKDGKRSPQLLSSLISILIIKG